MSKIWLLKSNDVQILAMARDYHHAREQFKCLLKHHIEKEPYPLLDELIEISRINEDNTIDEIESYIEFTDDWLRELGVRMDVIVY
ncbi:hypothetical protein [[Eubacterium] cellulosolvens]